MKLSKQQKTGLIFLAIALVALVVDRAFLGGGSVPAEASASSHQTPVESAPSPVEPAPAPTASPETDLKLPTIQFIDRIETLWSQRDLDVNQARDIFALPTTWLADVLPAKPEDQPQPKQDAVTIFMTGHQLRAVVISDQSRSVNVNDHILRIGDELDGFTLVAVGEDSATFEAGGRQAILRLVSDR